MSLDNTKSIRIITPVTLGIDLKVTENGDVGVIEINGANSGISGLCFLLNECKQQLAEYFELKRFYMQIYKPTVLKFRLQDQDYTDGLDEVIKNPELLDSYRLIFARENYQGYKSISERALGLSLDNNKKNIKNLLFSCLNKVFGNQFLEFSPDQIDELFLKLGIVNYSWDNELGMLVQLESEVEYEEEVIEAISQANSILPKLNPCLVIVDKVPSSEDRFYIDPRHIVLSYPVSESEVSEFEISKVYTKINSKIDHKDFIPKQNRAPYLVWKGNRDDVIQFVESLKTESNGLINLRKFPYIVIKPVSEAHGNNIDIFSIEDVEAILAKLESKKSEEWLIEGFIPSKPINDRDGCMRYLVDFYVIIEDGRMMISKTLESAYWRLAPSELDSNSKLNDIFKANLTGSKRALPDRVTNSDFELVRPVVNSIVRQIAIAVQKCSILDGNVDFNQKDKIENPTIVIQDSKNGSRIYRNVRKFNKADFDPQPFFSDFPEIRFKKR